MTPKDALDRQAGDLDRLLTALIKKYQFRDRNEICCGDVTVSECHVMKELGRQASLEMGKLAERMSLKPSTLTRLVDQLQRKGYAARRRPPADRRVCCVELTAAGRQMLNRMEARIRASERDVLRRLPEADRQGLLNGLKKLNSILETRKKQA